MAYSNIDFDSKHFRAILNKYENAKHANVGIYMEIDDLINIAEFYYINGNINQAIETLSYALTLFPNTTMPLIFRARIALLDENNADSAKEYANLIVDKNDLDYIYLQAEITIVENHIEKADAFLEKYKENIDEEDIPDFILDVATIFTDYNCYDYAEKWLSMSDEYELADYKELKGRIALGKGNYEESESIFQEMLDTNPFSGQIWNDLASAQLLNNKIKESIDSSEFSIAINPNDEEAILNKANCLFIIGNYKESLEYFKRFTLLRPQEDIGYLFQGNCLLNLNRPEEALLLYKKAEEKAYKSINRVDIYQEIAYTLSYLGYIDEALNYIKKAENLTNGDCGELMVLKGYILLEHNRIEEAQACFQTAMRYSDFSPKIFLHIAISIFDCNYFKIAYKMFKAIPQFYDDNLNEGYSYMALCCKQLGKNEEFLKYLKKACEINPNEAKLVLGYLFPKNMDVADYYSHMYNDLNIKGN